MYASQKMRSGRCVSLTALRIVAAAISVLLAGGLQADTYVWSTNTTGAAQDGPGAWNTSAANWVGAGDVHTAWNNAGGDTAAFGAGGTAGTVTVDAGGITIGGLLFNAVSSGSYTLAGGPLTLAGAPVFTANTNAAVNAALLGAAGFSKTGAGTLSLGSKEGAFTGNVSVQQGTLAATANNTQSGAPINSALGYLLSPRTVTVESGATLQFNASDVLGNAGAAPLVALSVKSGGQVKNSSTFNVLGLVNLEGGAITTTGGVYPTYQSFQFINTVTSGGAAVIGTSGGTYNGVHLGNNLFAVTGGTLTVSAPLLNKYGNSTAGFAKSGSGVMVLAADNSFGGAVTVSNGVLQVGAGGAAGTLGTGANAVSLVNADATLLFNRSGFLGHSGAISGGGSLVKDGESVLTLSGANSYAGHTAISNGVLAVTTTNALPGYAAAGRVTLEPGAALSVGVGSWTTDAINALLAAGVYGPGTGFGFDTTAGNYTYNGQFALPAVAGLVKTGPYALTISGGNTCAGGVTALGGILQADFGVGLPDTTNLTLSGASVSSASGSVTASLGTGAGELNLVPGSASGFSAVDVPLTVNVGGAGAALSWGAAEFNPSALVLNELGANTNLTLVNGLTLNGATRTVNVNATAPGAAAEIGGAIANGSGAAGLVKGGVGTLRLSAANTYSGGTTVNAGTLALTGGDNRLNTGANLTVNAATLDLGGGSQAMTAGTFVMNNGAALRNGTLSYYKEWELGGGVQAVFAGGGGMTSPGRLILRYGPTLTLSSDAGASAFGGDGGSTCNFVGVDSANNNALVVNGGSLNFTNMAAGAGYLRLGANGTASVKPVGVLNVSGGAVNVGHSMSLGTRYDNGGSAAYGEATFTLNDGDVTVGTGSSATTNNGNRGWLYLGNGNASTVSKSTINLNGGALSLARLESGFYGTNTLNFNGGTLKARADGTLINGPKLACNVAVGGAMIDTAGFDVDIAANLTGLGNFTKQGNGTLTLCGSNTVSGDVSVEAGTLTLAPLSKGNLRLHLDASDASTLFQNSDGTGAVTASGQQVGYWGDTSGNGKPALQSTSDRRPTYVTGAAGFNGLPVLQFDGSDDDITSLFDLNATNHPDVTIVMIYRKVSKKVNGGLWGHDNGSCDRMQLLDFGSVGADKTSGDNTSIAVNGMNTTNVVVYTAVLRNGVVNGSYVYVDGVSDASTGLSAFTSREITTGYASMTIANISSGNGYRGNIQIGEVLVYDTALGDAARRNVEAYLKNKWEGASESYVPVLQTATISQPSSAMFPGIRLWLDASSQSSLFTNSTGVGSVTTSGQPVGYWGDLSGSCKPALQGTAERRPNYVEGADGFNGHPILQFDGSDDDITSYLDFNATNLPNVTLFVVYKQLEKSGNAGLWGHDNGGWDRLQLFYHAGAYYQVATAGNAVSVKGMETNKVALYTAVLRNGVPNGSYVYINGRSDSTSGLPAFTSQEGLGLPSFTLGNIAPGSSYCGNIQVGEVLVFDSALSDAARGNVETYLRAKWTGQTATNVLTLASGAVLDLDGSSLQLTAVSGGTISNGTLTVASPLSPGGDGVVGTQKVANVALNGTLLVDVSSDGTCDQLVGSGAVSLSGLALKVADTGLLNRAKAYVIVTCAGTLSGSFASNNLPDNWRIRYDYAKGTAAINYVAPGTMLSIK